jgi:uncharacterized protein YjbI with pentapeptide repeats
MFSMIMTPDQNLTNYDRAIEFLKSSVAARSSQLEAIGLLRYAKLLTQMGVSDVNIECVEQFFAYPSRAKFPQLMGTDLQGLDLRGVNFIRANLSEANLAGCCLQDADLIFGNFSEANLSRANLRGATLNETIWTGANVYECDFRETIGLTTTQVRELRSAGGIFEES